ncbi:phosphotransferase [Streptomyces sp. NPDC002588]|uniref:phosphotransferase n=1 Tax=Streptomyces sp. NPDC002588 TaxID=3154419 RepID=UPI003321C062
MRDRPTGLSETAPVRALADGWAVEARSVEYLPVGAGSHHWSAVDRHGTAWFVKADDLGAEVGGRDDAFGRLGRSLSTALALKHDAGLGYVLAPVPALTGAVVWRPTPRYALSVFPMIAGVAGQFGVHRPEDRAEVTDLLAELHRATPLVADTAPRTDLVLPGRERLLEALRDLDREWTGGPSAEPARRVLAAHAGRVHGWLADFDRYVDTVRGTEATWVVTHGEPHPGNIMRTPAGLWLIDWGTVRIAPPERDLWMLTTALADLLGEERAGGENEVLARYTRATGRIATPAGIALYRMWWTLADIAVFADELRRPHGTGEDIALALTCLTGYLQSSRTFP